MTIVATFVIKKRYSIVADSVPAANGSVWADPAGPVGGYDDGTQVTLTATPASGYRFDRWSGDISGSQNQVTVNMTSNKSITAHFSKPFPWLWVVLGVLGVSLVSLPFFPPVSRRLRGIFQAVPKKK